MELDATLGVRALHVLAATLAVGIPVGLSFVLAAGPAPDVVERLVWRAERVQWVALGVLLATGVGNLAAFGDGLPDVSSSWARVLFVKLGFVLLLLVVSAVRTFVIAGIRTRSAPGRGATRGTLGRWYAGTGGLGMAIVGLAIALAHG